MAGGVTLQVRQVGSYPLALGAGAGDLLLMQPGGLGNPYASISAATLVATALEGGGGPLGVGAVPAAGAASDQIFAGSMIYGNPGAGPLFNLYFNTAGQLTYLAGGIGAAEAFENGVFAWQVTPPGVAGAVVGGISNLMLLNIAGGLSLPQGTLTVARDPGAAMEVATMGWVGRSTVTSFNGRQGAITLNGCDIYSALCLDSTIATENWVNASIQASIQMLLANHPFVFGWNGRTGAVYLTLADISCVFFQPGQQPITQTPPLTSNDYSIPNTAWVTTYVEETLAGQAGLATQAWVLANTVNSFNGRMGPVTLTLADITAVGGAPIVSNYVDNSGFAINQRGYASGTALAAGAYGLDRWKAGAAGCTLTFTGVPASTVVTITAGSLQQVVEGQNMLTATYTLSWSGTATGRIAGTSGGGTYAASPIQFSAAANTNTFIEFTGGTLEQVQLQLGATATAWQPLPLAIEMERCQRMYQVTGGIIARHYTQSGGVDFPVGLPVAMRASPTVTIPSFAFSDNTSSISPVSSGASVVSFQIGYAAAGMGGVTMSMTASADL